MIRYELGSDVAAELAARQSAFLASGEAEEWLLPPGEHVLPAGLTLGQVGRTLAICGQVSTVLRIASNGLIIHGQSVVMRAVQVIAEDGAVAVEVAGAEITLDRVDAESGQNDEPGAAILINATGLATLTHCHGALQRGSTGHGVAIHAPTAHLTGVRGTARADTATGIFVQATGEAIVADCAARGVRAAQHAAGVLVIAPELEVMSVLVDDVRGGSCEALGLYSPGTGSLLALDVSVSRIDATGAMCRGAMLACSGPVQVRGVSVTELIGQSSHGITVVATGAVEIDGGTVSQVRGQGQGATGLRVMTTGAQSAVFVRDVTAEAVGGTDPRAEARPPAGFSAWAEQTMAALDAGDFAVSLVPGMPVEANHEVAGMHIGAPVDAVAWARARQPAPVQVEDVVLHRIAGTALQIEAGLRAAHVRRAELWTSARAGWIQAEQLLLAELTVHRHLAALRIGPGEARVFNSIFSTIPGGAAPVLDDEAELAHVAGAFATDGSPPWGLLDGLPYRDPGPLSVPASLADGVRPPAVDVDLGLRRDAAIADQAVAVPGDTTLLSAAQMGARAADIPAPCDLKDPQPFTWREPAPVAEPNPVANYQARDARLLLDLMLERARTTMVSWSERGPSDMTQMIFELLADRLDHLAYEQERAVAEGFLQLARLRRSVEDHARPLDYRPDPGLSATTMIRFQIDHQALARVAGTVAHDGNPCAVDLIQALSDGKPLELPAGTLVGNADPGERSVLFASEALLTYLPELEEVGLAESCPRGATSLRLAGRLEHMEVGRWLVLSRGRGFPGHVIRVTRVELETDTTRIAWDPRRPTQHDYPAEVPAEVSAPSAGTPVAAVIFGNVVPAHHGVPVRAMTDADEPDAMLGPWQALLKQVVDGAETREVEVPLAPISVQARGYPLPGAERTGRLMIRVLVENDEWAQVDDLSLYGPGDEVYVVRPGPAGHPVLRFGDGVNGAALPGRSVELRMELTVGLGAAGNVGAFTLNRLIRFGPVHSDAGDPEAMILATAGPERDDLVRAIWQVSNPLPGVGGRNPEPIERIRYRAPLQVRDNLSAVAPRDYEELLLRMPDVAGARARVIEAGVRHVIRVTILLRDEDTLPEAELLRRWSQVRRRLEEIRMLGFDVEAIPPTWVPLDIDMVVDAEPHADPGRLRDNIKEALAGNGGLLDPDTIGLGGDVRLSSIYQTVQGLAGVQAVRVTRFRRLEAGAREYLGEGVIPMGSHEVATIGGPRNPDAGLLTVSVCGGLR